jgi:hypothetical protein
MNLFRNPTGRTCFSRTSQAVAILSLLGIFFFNHLASAESQKIYQTDLVGPPGSGSFGTQVVVLPNGNIVATDPDYSTPSAANVGAVYLYDPGLNLISVLTGSQPGDRVGGGGGVMGGSPGVTVLSSGDFVVSSPFWNNYRGAVTWVSGASGLSGKVSAQNSLVGVNPGSSEPQFVGDLVGGYVAALPNGGYVTAASAWNFFRGAVTLVVNAAGRAGQVGPENSLVGERGGDNRCGDCVGSGGFVVLPSGNFLVLSQYWNISRGAVTWVSGSGPLPAAISSANSLVGSSFGDYIGRNPWLIYQPEKSPVTILPSGNYLVYSPLWHNGEVKDAGAVTWGSGTSGVSGAVSPLNSLVGARAGDLVGIERAVTLTDGSYVIPAPWWDLPSDQDAGAVTWGSGTSGAKGVISAANSLVGSGVYHWVGFGGVVPLANGGYVVLSPRWDSQKGAATWGGPGGVKGYVSAGNSLVGEATFDRVGGGGVTALTNGNYVVASPDWNGYRGAATWGSGASGVSGAVSAANSLVGSFISDQVGWGVKALANGNYVVSSPRWDNQGPPWLTDAGAVTWGSAASGVSGAVSPANSLVGSSSGDMVGAAAGQIGYDVNGVTPLSNGHYAVGSSYWDNGGTADAGAVTWVNGSGPISGFVTAANSLVGSSPSDRIGSLHNSQPGSGVVALNNGNYVVASAYWDNGAAADAGAVTWRSGAGPGAGVVSAANSQVGGNMFDYVGSHGVTALPNGNYVARSRFWSDMQAGRTETGALTWGSGAAGASGAVSPANSLVGKGDLDWAGTEPLSVLSSGDYLVYVPTTDSETGPDAGALSWGWGSAGLSGVIGPSNSVLGIASGQGAVMTFQADLPRQRVLVARSLDQIVSVVELQPRLLVRLEGVGSGTVTSSPAGINCGSQCSALLSPGQQVTLSAAAAPGSEFTGWSGACSGTGTCQVTMDEARQVIASFTTNVYTLSVSKSGAGAGTVTSSPEGIECGSQCSADYVHGTLVTLSAAAAPGSEFTGWSGACSGTGPCQVTMDASRSVGAAFSLNTSMHQLSVSLSGEGSGKVSSIPAGIDCGGGGSACTAFYPHSTLVTLSAEAQSNSTFTGWAGACSGMDKCTLTMDSARGVTASFSELTEGVVNISVNKFGDGFGRVTSLPGGIDCGSDCSSNFLEFSEVILTAQPAPGSTFEGWSGPCTGTGLCTLWTSDNAESVWAHFATDPAAARRLYLPAVLNR